MISKMFEIRDIVGFRFVEWDNNNPRHPVRIVKNQLAKREKLQCQNVDDNDVQPFYLGFFGWGRKSILKTFSRHEVARKKFFRPSRGVRRHAPLENFENIVF